MIARISPDSQDCVHCDADTLLSFALDQLDDQRIEIARHIETCAECQSRLETLSCGDLTWDEVGTVLRERGDDPFAGGLDESQDRASVHKAVASFLQPSEHPGSLGRFDRYEIMELLGRGGMGIVMRGFDPALERHCAIKVLAPQLASSGAARRRFSREAKSAAAVVHQHVVPIQNVDQCDGLPYLVMPVVEGQSLQRRVEENGPLEIVEAVRIAGQIAEGLAAAHAQGLVHRDIKPANILLENGVERVQITDFGLARAIDDASMTRSGIIAGTPQYMSPEQAHGESIDHRSDLFSLGSVMYFMLTGRSPFRAETTMGVLHRITHDDAKPIREINSGVPGWLEAIVMRLLARSPEQRFRTADEASQLLADCLQHLQKPTDHPLPAELARVGNKPPRKHLFVVLAVAIPILLAGIFITLKSNKGTITIKSERDDIPIVIKKGGKVYDKLTVGKEGTTMRVYAGEYELAFDGKLDRMAIDNDKITLGRGKEEVVFIRDLRGEFVSGPDVVYWEAEKRNSVPETPRSPFTDVDFQGDTIIVTWQGQEYEWVSIDGIKVTDIVQFAKSQYSTRWQKRVAEDLVEVVAVMNHQIGDTARVELRNSRTGKLKIVTRAPVTYANRQKVYENRNFPGEATSARKEFFEGMESEIIRRERVFDAAREKAVSASDSEEVARINSEWFRYHESFFRKYLSFEEEHRGTDDGFEALRRSGGDDLVFMGKGGSEIVTQALDRIVEHYIERDAEIDSFIHTLEDGLLSPQVDEFLEAIENKSPNPEIQAESIVVQLTRGREILRMKPKLAQLREETQPRNVIESKIIDQWFKHIENIDAEQLRRNLVEKTLRLATKYNQTRVHTYGIGSKAAKRLSFSIQNVIVGKPAPDLSANDVNGKLFRLSDYRGKHVVLIFHQIDDYSSGLELARKYSGQPVHFVSVVGSWKNFGDGQKLKEAMGRGDINFTVISENTAGPLSLDWGADVYHKTYVVNPGGILHAFRYPHPPIKELEEYLGISSAANITKESRDIADRPALQSHDQANGPPTSAPSWLANLVCVFFKDESRRAIPAVIIKSDGKAFAVTTGSATIVPDGTTPAVDRTYVEMPGRRIIGAEYNSSFSNVGRYAAQLESSPNIPPLETTSLSVGDRVDAVGTHASKLALENMHINVLRMNASHDYELKERDIKRTYDGLIVVSRQLREGTPLLKDGKLAGIVLLGSRFLKDDEPVSYVLPAKRVVEQIREAPDLP